MSSPARDELGDRAADPRHRQPGVEQRRDHAQRDEVAERVGPDGSVVVGHDAARCGATRRAARCVHPESRAAWIAV